MNAVNRLQHPASDGSFGRRGRDGARERRLDGFRVAKAMVLSGSSCGFYEIAGRRDVRCTHPTNDNESRSYGVLNGRVDRDERQALANGLAGLQVQNPGDASLFDIHWPPLAWLYLMLLKNRLPTFPSLWIEHRNLSQLVSWLVSPCYCVSWNHVFKQPVEVPCYALFFTSQ